MIARESLDEEWGIRLDDFVRPGLRPSGVIDSPAPRMAVFELDVSCHGGKRVTGGIFKERRRFGFLRSREVVR